MKATSPPVIVVNAPFKTYVKASCFIFALLEVPIARFGFDTSLGTSLFATISIMSVTTPSRLS